MAVCSKCRSPFAYTTIRGVGDFCDKHAEEWLNQQLARLDAKSPPLNKEGGR